MACADGDEDEGKETKPYGPPFVVVDAVPKLASKHDFVVGCD